MLKNNNLGQLPSTGSGQCPTGVDTAENTTIKLLEAQNQTLRNYLAFRKKSSNQMILANIFAKRTELGDEYFVIDVGQDDGIKEGMAVVEQNGFLTGRISKVEKNFSYFSPILDSNLSLKISFLPSNTNKILTSGILSNQQSSVLEINYVLSGQNIQKGDKVITAESSEYFPRNILIGEVQLVENEPHQLFQKIIVRPYADLDNILMVGVIFPVIK